MAKKQISDVLIKFKGDHKGLDNAIGGSKSSLNRFAASARTAAGALIKIGAVGAVAMAGLSFAAWKMTAAAKDYGVAIDKAMKVTGLGAQTITEMAYAAEQEHASIEDLEKGWKRLSKAMVDADDGLAESKRAFEGIGVSIYDVSGKLKTVDVMTYELADAFSAMSDDTKKAGLAQDLFGRAGMNLIPFLEMGSKGIQELGAESKALGNVWTDDMAAASKKFDDKLTEINYSLRATKWAIGNELMPEFEKILDWITTNSDWMKTTFTEIFDIEFANFGDLVVAQLDKVKAWIDANKADIKWWVDLTKSAIEMQQAHPEVTRFGRAAMMGQGAQYGAEVTPGIVGGAISGAKQKIEIVLDSGAVEKFLSGQVVGVTNFATISGT